MRSIRILTALTLGTLAMFLAGCSKSPVAPETSMSGQPGAQTHGVGTREEDPAPPQSGGTSNTQTATLAVGNEGSITVGRFTLRLHKNTLKMPTTFVLHVDNAEATEVQIQVSPPEANDLRVAAELTANVSDLPGFNYDTATVHVWEGTWMEAEEVSAHPNQQNVVARVHKLSMAKLASNAVRNNAVAE